MSTAWLFWPVVVLLVLRAVLQAAHWAGAPIPARVLRLTSWSYLHLQNGALRSVNGWKVETIALADLDRVEYAYSAVVGFTAVWIFVSRDGREITAAPYRTGLKALLPQLERELPPFTIAQWAWDFKCGDVEDTLVVWSHRNQHPQKAVELPDSKVSP